MKNKCVFLCILEIIKYFYKRIGISFLPYFNDKSIRCSLVLQFFNGSLHSNFTIVQKSGFSTDTLHIRKDVCRKF